MGISSLSRIHDVVGSNGQNAKGNSLFAALSEAAASNATINCLP